ncbi:cysteine desulfurase mitochondrial-like [Senna tora]|uniref:Cysteine desulfurase mitochondrial-like n=1 Tax=Senna tora TaxID=362788 RepID=A0A834WVK2_9FABA|nr:cysteine desulfurase mitochondrial-like [Senna tora]
MGYPLWLILCHGVEGFPSFYEPPPSVKDLVLSEARVAVKSRDPGGNFLSVIAPLGFRSACRSSVSFDSSLSRLQRVDREALGLLKLASSVSVRHRSEAERRKSVKIRSFNYVLFLVLFLHRVSNSHPQGSRFLPRSRCRGVPLGFALRRLQEIESHPRRDVLIYQGNCLLFLSFAWLIMAKSGDHSKEGDLYDRCLFAKILTKKIIHRVPLEMTLRNIWGRPRGFRIKEIGPQFIFDSKDDANRILRKGPWLFRNSWIILRKWQEDLNSLEKGPNKVPIWIQMRGLPLHRITHSMARKVGSIIGKVKETGLFQESNGDNLFLKARVEIDINFKVIQDIKIVESYWVELKYERLCQFCFGCRQIGHNLHECEEKKNFRRNDPPPLGPWLKAYHPGKIVTENRNCGTSMSISSKITWMQKPKSSADKDRHGHLVQNRQPSISKRKRKAEEQSSKKKRKWMELEKAKCNVEKIGQQFVNMIEEEVNVGFDEGLEVRKGEKWRQRKRRSEIRLISLGLYIIGEGITIPFTKRRKKDWLVIDNNLATIGVYEELKPISIERKGMWEASPERPPMEG